MEVLLLFSHRFCYVVGRCWSRTHSGGPTSVMMASCGISITTGRTWSRHWVELRASSNTPSSREPTSPRGRVCSGEHRLTFAVVGTRPLESWSRDWPCDLVVWLVTWLVMWPVTWWLWWVCVRSLRRIHCDLFSLMCMYSPLSLSWLVTWLVMWQVTWWLWWLCVRSLRQVHCDPFSDVYLMSSEPVMTENGQGYLHFNKTVHPILGVFGSGCLMGW